MSASSNSPVRQPTEDVVKVASITHSTLDEQLKEDVKTGIWPVVTTVVEMMMIEANKDIFWIAAAIDVTSCRVDRHIIVDHVRLDDTWTRHSVDKLGTSVFE